MVWARVKGGRVGFYRPRRGVGESGRELLGEERMDVAARPAILVACEQERGGAWRASGFASRLRETVDGKSGEARQLARAGLGAWPARWRRQRTATALGTEQEVEDGDRGISVNRQSFRGSTIKQGFL